MEEIEKAQNNASQPKTERGKQSIKHLVEQNAAISNIDPEILIVDEALSVGDRAFRDKCTKKVKEIMQGDITLLFVTHSPEIAKAFCTRGIVMKNGKIVFDGTIDEAIDYYATKY